VGNVQYCQGLELGYRLGNTNELVAVQLDGLELVGDGLEFRGDFEQVERSENQFARLLGFLYRGVQGAS